MALATRCPHCSTTFRVVPDQLKLRAGLVRCGACKQIFNGLEHLLPREETPNTVISPMADIPGTAPNSPVPATPSRDANSTLPPPTAQPIAAPAPQSPPPVEPAREEIRQPVQEPVPESDDPLLRMTLMDFSEFERAAESRATPAEEKAAAEEFNQAVQDLQTTLRNDPKRAASLSKMEDQVELETPEPAFVQQARRQAQIGHRRQLAMRAATIVLSIGLLGQAAYVFRDQLAAWVPQITPALAKGCALLGCSVGLPAQIDAVSIESSELQALAASQNTFVLVTLLRNRSATAQTWPHIELTLNDGNEKPIVRRVIGPRDYLLSAQEAAKGLASNSEQSVKVFFELSQLKASGYRVYLFYP